MATQGTAPSLRLFSAQIVERHKELIEEDDEIKHNFELREQQELNALEADKKRIQDAIKEERDGLVANLPAEMPFPESFDKFLSEKLNDKVRKRQEEYKIARAERQKLYEAEKLRHAEKWKAVLFPAMSNSIVTSPDLSLSIPETRPREQLEIQQPTAPKVVHQPRPELIRPADTPRALAHQREVAMMLSQAQQYAGIVVPQLLPRPRPVPSQAGRDIPARASLNNISHAHPHAHYPVSQTRPVEIQRASFPSQPPRVPEQNPIAKPGPTVLEAERRQEGTRQELPRPPPPGSYNLPRILPLAEQQHHVAQFQRAEHEVGRNFPGGLVQGADHAFKQFKRKADAQPVPPQVELKRTKVHGTTIIRDASATRFSKKIPAGQKTISFDEVFQNGNPQFKHVIVEYPMNSRKFYILKCEEHGVHFNQNPLAGAAKHLHSAQHGNMSKERAQAVEYLGYLIYDCDEAKMRRNNELVMQAFSAGYKPLNLNQLTKAERANLHLPGDMSPTGTPKAPPLQRSSTREGLVHERSAAGPLAHQKVFTGITHPVPGELYLGYWATEKRNYAVLMLPFGDLKPAGMQGSLESTGLLDRPRVPRCYIYTESTGVWSWAPGYEDGGPLVVRREFPVMYFDGRSSVGWLRAKDMSIFNFDDPMWKEIPYFKEAVNHYARVRGFSGFQEMREQNVGKDGRFYGQNQLKLHLETSTGDEPPAAALSRNQTQPIAPVPGVPRAYLGAQEAPRIPNGLPISPSREVEMLDASPTSDRDSYQESINKGILDSDNDAEMANTESRRTSISNRGDSQMEPSVEKATVLKQPFAQPVVPAGVYQPRPIDIASQKYSGDATGPPGGGYRPPPVGPLPVHMPPNPPSVDGPEHRPVDRQEKRATPSPQLPASRSPSQLAQIIASKALHLSPEREPSAPALAPATREADLARHNGPSETVSRPGSVSSTDHGYRRVEKIHAKSANPYRASPNQSPSMSTTMLPDRASEKGTPQPGVSRHSSPASLHNILQNPSPQPIMARPGPLSQNGPASLYPPQHARHAAITQRAPSLDRNASLTPSPQPAMRSPSKLSTGHVHAHPSPARPQPHGLGIITQSQPTQERQPSPSPVQERQPMRSPAQERQIAQSPIVQEQQSLRSPVKEQPQQVGSANLSPQPVASKPPTRTGTPVILQVNDETNGERWKAVRADPTPKPEVSEPQKSSPTKVVEPEQQQAPVRASVSPPRSVKSPVDIPASVQPTVEMPTTVQPPAKTRATVPVAVMTKERVETPVQLREVEVKPSPAPSFAKSEAASAAQFFDLACVQINDSESSFDHSMTGGQLLRLAVDPQTRTTASTAPDASIQLTIDPKQVKQAVVKASNVSPTASTVSLVAVDGKEMMDLVFEMSESSSGRIHARRFCRWMKGVNSALDYKNQGQESSSAGPGSARRSMSMSSNTIVAARAESQPAAVPATPITHATPASAVVVAFD